MVGEEGGGKRFRMGRLLLNSASWEIYIFTLGKYTIKINFCMVGVFSSHFGPLTVKHMQLGIIYDVSYLKSV